MTKYRRKVITKAMLTRLADVFQSVASKWDAKLLEFNGESEKVHLLISYPPHKLLSNLIANLKSTSSKTMWQWDCSCNSHLSSKLTSINHCSRCFITGNFSLTRNQLADFGSLQSAPTTTPQYSTWTNF
ncbi:MAG: IS200/IS605 family transposase [Symploca sp. SIO2C1]|nr:IS200/IS605 family transposase [Symploca sp. SIO2C1]